MALPNIVDGGAGDEIMLSVRFNEQGDIILEPFKCFTWNVASDCMRDAFDHAARTRAKWSADSAAGVTPRTLEA